MPFIDREIVLIAKHYKSNALGDGLSVSTSAPSSDSLGGGSLAVDGAQAGAPAGAAPSVLVAGSGS